MVVLGIVIEFALWFYILFIFLRLVVDWVQLFARSWHPAGPALVALELVYSATDPPIRLIRRLVPPLRLGGQVIDLSVMFVLLVAYIMLVINRKTLLGL